MDGFIQRHRSSVIGILNGFDRVRIRGTLRWLCYVDGFGKYLSAMKVLLKDFKRYAEGITDRVRRATERIAEEAGRPLQYLGSPSTSKEEVARAIAERDGIGEGLICVLSAVEPCWSFSVGPNRERKQLELRAGQRKCLHYYHYWIHPVWGFMHARLQTWFPFTVHLCLHGREWLGRQMDRAGMGYERRDNCFVRIADVERAQALMNRQLRTNWWKMLQALVPAFHPVHQEIVGDGRSDYYWSVESSEWASDVMFESPSALRSLYPRLLEHGMRHFGSREVMRFLGRRVPARGGVNGRFEGEVVSDLRERPEGMRIKHRVNQNSIKMYDKQGSVLRVETTLNNADDVKVYRPKEGDEGGAKGWRQLRRGVADIHRRAAVCQAANERYLESLAAVGESTSLGELAETVCRPVKWKGKRARALNPLSSEDAALLGAVNRGEFAIHGFRNRDLRALLSPYGTPDPHQARRQSAAMGRKLRLLRAHGLIRKVSHTQRYVLSPKGRIVINALLAARAADTAKLANAA